ncbi:MAG: o-succinylbenzoate--CoA ligase [Chloroflexi bacterium]|nr:o-succinylbenzoate--CoA ligase [Chloroflexota bacterium]
MRELKHYIDPNPDSPFIYVDGRKITFGGMNRLVSAGYGVIQRYTPLEPGDKVGILMPDRFLFVVTLLALMRMRVVSVPLNTRLTAAELSWQVKNADCRLLICEGDTRALAGELGTDVMEMPNIDLADPTPQFADYGLINLDDDFAIIHTSGTSGRPKAAILTLGNVYQSAQASAQLLGHLENECWLCVLPLYHVGGLSIILRSLIYSTAVEFGPTSPFDVQETNRVLSANPITLISLVPTMLQRLLDAKTRPWNPQLRLILLGGEAPSAELLARCQAENLPIATTYGLTETASQVATALPEQVYRKPGTVGKPLKNTQVRIVGEGGEGAAPKVPGEVLVKGGTVMRGYYGDPAATDAALRDGWLQTGDIGYLDEDGDLFILQRRADLIVSGGENIYPAEVERVLRSHPQVAEAVVFGAPDAQWGQRVAALIQPVFGASISTKDIDRFLRERLASYKSPRKIVFVDALPLTASGKIQRREARRIFDDAVSHNT